MDNSWHEEKLGMMETVRLLTRNLPLVSFCALVFLVLGIAYLSIKGAEYTADATIMLVYDNERTGNEDRLQAELETHRSLISSDASLVAVLSLVETDLPAETEGFAVRAIDIIRRMLSREPLVVSKETSSEQVDETQRLYDAKFRRLAPAIRDRLKIERQGQSRLLRLSYSAPNSEEAVAFVNTLAQVYSDLSALPNVDENNSESLKETSASSPSTASNNGLLTKSSEFSRVIETVELSTVEATRVTPNVAVVFAVSIFLGLVFGGILAVRKEYTRST